MSNIFDVLKDYHTIIAYEENMEEINEFIKYSPSKICYLKLSKYPELKEKFIQKYQIKELPCMISFGNLVCLNENLEKDLLVVKEKEKNFYFDFISNLKNKNRIFIFIKGSVKEPKCKFTRRLLEIFNELDLVYEKDYDYFDILSDEKLRELCKEYNNWQTFPQIFIKGNFYGGLDVLINGVKDKTIFDLIK